MARPTNRIHVCYYITGHGLGHATRSIELIRCLIEDRFIVHIVSPVPESFFTDSLKFNKTDQSLFHYARTLDTGAIQTSPLDVDPHTTLDSYLTKIHKNRQGLVDFEVSWLNAKAIDIVLVDATPIGCIAGKLGKKCVVLVTNFTWDVIYQEMLKSLQCQSYKKDNHDHDITTIPQEMLLQYQEMIDQISTDLACDRYIQLPGETPIPPQCEVTCVTGGPLIARIANTDRQKAWRQEIMKQYRSDLDPESLKVLLLGFGGHTADWKLQDEFLPAGWICLVLGVNKDADLLPSNRFIPMSFDSFVPDLIALSDVVLGKIGYGFVSECLANATPLVYVPRANWPEEPYVETLLNQHNAGVLMPSWDFHSGNWSPYLQLASVLKTDGWHIRADIAPATAAQSIVTLIHEAYLAASALSVVPGFAVVPANLAEREEVDGDQETIAEIPLD